MKDFAACATNRTFSATWVCRTERRTMKSCMITYATREEQDTAREEWFSSRVVNFREGEDEKKGKEHEQLR